MVLTDKKEIVGDVSLENTHDIWHGEKVNYERDNHKKNISFMEMENCRKFYYPRKIIPNETALIYHRKITI